MAICKLLIYVILLSELTSTKNWPYCMTPQTPPVCSTWLYSKSTVLYLPISANWRYWISVFGPRWSNVTLIRRKFSRMPHHIVDYFAKLHIGSYWFLTKNFKILNNYLDFFFILVSSGHHEHSKNCNEYIDMSSLVLYFFFFFLISFFILFFSTELSIIILMLSMFFVFCSHFHSGVPMLILLLSLI